MPRRPGRAQGRAAAGRRCASPGSRTARPKNVAAKGKTLGPMRSIKSPVRNIAGRAAAATNRSATPRAVTDAPVCSLIAGSRTAHAPRRRRMPPNAESEPSRVTAAVAGRLRRARRQPPRSRSATPPLPLTESRTRYRTPCAPGGERHPLGAEHQRGPGCEVGRPDRGSRRPLRPPRPRGCPASICEVAREFTTTPTRDVLDRARGGTGDRRRDARGSAR